MSTRHVSTHFNDSIVAGAVFVCACVCVGTFTHLCVCRLGRFTLEVNRERETRHELGVVMKTENGMHLLVKDRSASSH